MKEIGLENLKEYLKQRSKEELIGEISRLFTRFEYVKDYHQTKLDQNDAQVLQKHKDCIIRALWGELLQRWNRYGKDNMGRNF